MSEAVAAPRDLVARLTEVGVFGPLDLHFARMLAALDPRAAPEVVLGGAWASRAVHSGHVCADLRRILSRRLLDADGVPIEDAPLPQLFDWVMALSSGSSLVGDGSGHTPLVFDGGARVYLARYFDYQRRLAGALSRRAARVDPIDAIAVRPVLDRLFARGELEPDPHQREAASVAVMRGLTVLSGGPGTGKTTTVVRMLALMQAEALARGAPPLRIALLSPTGKAAARMVETIGAHVDALDCDDAIKQAIPRTASTIHRLLGYLPGTPTRFLHDAALPVAADVVLVDEASMVDLALLAKLVDAVPEAARIVLVGDKDQLASVEAGAILGDICNAGDLYGRARSPWFATRMAALGGDAVTVDERAPAVADCVVDLTTNYRFQSDSAIGGLATAIKSGRRDEALARLHAARGRERGELRVLPIGEADALPQLLRPALLDGYRGYLRERDPEARLARLGEFRLLSPHRRGAFGIDRLNVLVERVLAEAGLVVPDGAWYDGRPVMVTANDYQLQLFNGDVGVLCSDAAGRLRAWFGTPGTPLRSFAPSRLPTLESVFAMTVHKSQGSEFDRVALLVPPQLSPILTRELLYTGLTRARREALLFGSPEVIADAIERRIERASGLRDALWGDAAR